MRRMYTLISLLFVAFLFLPIFLLSSGDPQVIDSTHPTVPLPPDAMVNEVEVTDDGGVVFVSYSTMGFSMLDLDGGSVRNFDTTTTPALTSEFIETMLFVPEKRCLYLVVSDISATETSLNIYDMISDDIRTIPLSDSDQSTNGIIYEGTRDKLYISTDDGILVIDATDEAVLGRIPIETDGLQGEVVDMDIASSGMLYMAVVNGTSNYLQIVDTATDTVQTGQDITLSGGTGGVDMTLGWSFGPLSSMAVLDGRGEIYLGFNYIEIDTDEETYSLMIYNMATPSLSTIFNISLYQTVDIGSVEPEYFNFRSWTINDMVRMGDESRVAFASSGVGSGYIDTTTRTHYITLIEIPNLLGVNYYLPQFQGGSNDIEYNQMTDTIWTSTYYSIGLFTPDDMITDLIDVGDDDDDTDAPDAMRVDDIIYIYYEGEEERMYEEGEPIGAGDHIIIYGHEPYSSDLPLMQADFLVIRLIDPLTGEIVKESVGDGYMVEMELKGEEISSSKYLLRVEGQNSDGDVVYYSEEYILIDNPNSRPISGALVATGAGLAAAIGAGVAITSLTTGASQSVGAASSASAGTGSSTWKNLLFGFATEYSEEKLKERTRKKKAVTGRSERGFINLREVVVIGITVVFMMIAFGYVEMMNRLAPHSTIGVLGIDFFAIPDFSVMSFLIVLPMVFFTSVIVILTVELAEEVSAKMLGLWSEFRIWPIGLLTLLLSSLLLMPFGYPGRAIARGDVKITRRMEGFIGSFVLCTMMTLLVPFSLIYLIGYTAGEGMVTDVLLTFGGLGLSILSMMLLAGAFPFKPMDGSKVWRMNKGLSAAFLVSAGILFWFWNFSFLLLPPFFSDWFIPIETWIGAMMMLFAGIGGGVVLLMMSAFGMWKGRDRGRDDYFDEEE